MRLITLSLAMLLGAPAALATPVQLTHQARLIDSSGAPIEGNHTVRVELWSALTGGELRWSDDFSADLEQGYFTAVLGDDNSLDSSLFATGPLYVQVLADSTPLGERTALATAPSAVHAYLADAGVPVGSVLPFAGDPALLGSNWALCDGGTVTDPDPSLRDFNAGAAGVQTPNLTDSRFIMGVAQGSVGITGGRNDIPSDGSHTHSFSQTSSDLAPDASSNTSGSYTNPAGAHTHGGENRPRYLGLQYIIRVR